MPQDKLNKSSKSKAKTKSKSRSKSRSKSQSRSMSRSRSRSLNRDPVEKNDEYKYLPIIVKLPKINKSIYDENPDVYFATNIDYPRSEYGFHHFIHQTKNTTEILKSFEGKKKVYLVFNRFERYIDNYDDNIGNVSKKFFELVEPNAPDIMSRGFYKLWEILLLFNLVDTKKSDFVSAHLAEGPGSFIQATIFYRDTYCKKGLPKNDKYYAVTLHPNTMGKKEYIPELEKSFVSFYEKEKPKRFYQHKTYTKQEAGGSKTKDNGDITDPKTIKLFGGEMAEKADLVTADGGFEWINENVQEQEAFRLIIAEIIAAVKVQKKDGNFVLKFFETFSRTSLKILSMLTELYDETYLVKPLTSRQSNSEKYAVCLKFKYSDKDKEYKNVISKLDKLLELIHKNKEENIVDIFSNYSLQDDMIKHVIHANIKIANDQFQNINQMMDFVKKEIYSGDVYHDKRDEQIDGAKYWINTFLQNVIKQSEMETIYKNIIKKVTDESHAKVKELSNDLVFVQSQN